MHPGRNMYSNFIHLNILNLNLYLLTGDGKSTLVFKNVFPVVRKCSHSYFLSLFLCYFLINEPSIILPNEGFSVLPDNDQTLVTICTTSLISLLGVTPNSVCLSAMLCYV